MKSENEIPKFDLAEQIMAGQRKFSAVKRIAPRAKERRLKTIDTRPQIIVQNSPVQEHNTQYAIRNTDSPDQIISEIVARDIQKFRSKPLVR